MRFNGQYTPQMGRTHLAELRRQLLADGLAQETDELQWMAAQVLIRRDALCRTRGVLTAPTDRPRLLRTPSFLCAV